jgi:flavin reductase (DIM6/NTAB) family NADH-FMN oxidoreductase RutF
MREFLRRNVPLMDEEQHMPAGTPDDDASRIGEGALPPDVDPDTFRAVMATVCTPVSVVTTMAGDRPHGSTVSAFASLSLNPPMVLVSLDLGSDLLRHIRSNRAFGLNVLHTGQAALAAAFARKGDDKFDGVAWVREEGVPRLEGCAGWLACTVTQLVPGGDHVVVFGRVVGAGHEAAPPLTYHQRRFGTHEALENDERPPGPQLPANVRYLRSRRDDPAADSAAGRGQPDSVGEWFAFN